MSIAVLTKTGQPALAGEDAAYFVRDGDSVYQPTHFADGYWGRGVLSGPAVAGLAAAALEARHGGPEFVPSRLTVDLLKPATRVPTYTQTRATRDGRRMRVAECDVVQGDWIVARATLLQYRHCEAPGGQEWSPEVRFTAPPGADGDVVFVGSDGVGWSPMGVHHQNTLRKRAYYRGLDVVAGEPVTPFVRAVIVAEAATNLVTNLGTDGIGYVNGDLTVALSRPPRSEFIGVQADSHWASDGVSVGCATLFDDAGPFGTGLVTAIANPAARIDFGGAAPVRAPGAELFATRPA